MSLTLLQAVIAINDARTLVTVLEPIVQQARNMGRGDDYVIPDDELDAHAAAVGANIQALRDMVAKP